MLAFADSRFSPSVAGGGGSASARVLAQWSFLFAKENNIQVNYAASNSRAGLRDISDRKVDFALTEIPMSQEEVVSRGLIQMPLLVGGVTPVVNVPGVAPGALRLNAALLARIYLGELHYWNDDEIRAANPGLNLPKLAIKPVVRDGASGTTKTFTTYLAGADARWASRMGASEAPAWPVPVAKAATTSAMTEQVHGTPGAIGYIALDEALRAKLAYVQLRNRSGRYVAPSVSSISAAIMMSGLGQGGSQAASLIDVTGEATWPIGEVTYVLFERKARQADRARTSLRFLYWAQLRGDQFAADAGFAPLPASIQAKNIALFRDVMGPDGAPLDFLAMRARLLALVGQPVTRS
ncbi:phosphate ABC transporter substrate-binding protein PstS [Niveibacterium umoris]|uniref:phosphate ABC transporter substrate-binding protein PstS n=1 Tax=Niveibacterium umoris TaxID=1193620 RepID=UPI001F5E1F33|nr:phosphate ABC transporter substrate-binding protein PstS [Niveibacterium umoris]